MQAEATLDLCLAWFDRCRGVVAAAQPHQGEPSHSCRCRPADSKLEPQRSLAKQFNLLRIVDNQHHPAFFYWRGRHSGLQVQLELYDRLSCSEKKSLAFRVLTYLVADIEEGELFTTANTRTARPDDGHPSQLFS